MPRASLRVVPEVGVSKRSRARNRHRQPPTPPPEVTEGITARNLTTLLILALMQGRELVVCEHPHEFGHCTPDCPSFLRYVEVTDGMGEDLAPEYRRPVAEA